MTLVAVLFGALVASLAAAFGEAFADVFSGAGLALASFGEALTAFFAGLADLAGVFLLPTSPFLVSGFGATTGLAAAFAFGLLFAEAAVALTGFFAAGFAAALGFETALVGALFAGFLAEADFGLTVAAFLAGLLAAALTGLACFFGAAEARVAAALALSLVAEFFTVFLLVAMDRSTLGS